MALTSTKINTIRNINLIYVFSTNSIFNKESNKYVGIKLVYNNLTIIEADYKDPLFGELIKRVLDRYNKEKDSRNIILLGDFTKKLINESNFYVLDGKEEKKDQISYYSYENKLLNKYKPYLFETIKLVFNEVLKCGSFNIENLEGYNKMYKLDYSIDGAKKSSKMTIYNKENSMHFKMANVDNNDYISGVISEENNLVKIEYKFNKYIGVSTYDAFNMDDKKEIYADSNLYYINDNLDTVLEEDKNKVMTYLSLLGLNDVNILKVNDDTFLCFCSDSSVKDGQILYKDNLIFVNLEEDIVRIINSIKEGFSKYAGIVNVLLDSKEDSITIRKLFEINNIILIKENCINGDYNYSLRVLDEDINLKNEFDLNEFNDTIVNSVDDVKQYKKEVIR